ncbi:MAG: hypothetical protein WAM70_07630 [Pyrinomonadaceae bacterium]
MKVVNINSRRLFGQFYPPAYERVPEGLKFLSGVVLTFVAPTLAYCYVTHEVRPLYLMACQLVIGITVRVA